jgi:succinoglycan biosynthesis protein ExoM
MSDKRPHITVCVCTFRRAEPLRRLLKELEAQETGGVFSLSIVVADNDGSQSAKAVVEAFGRSSSTPIIYCTEPEQNIALARNKALAQAAGEFIAFIDDDEFPANDWLLHLFKTCEKYGVAGVLGPVKPYFEVEPPSWIKAGKFFERPSHMTGFSIEWTEGRTGNVLFKREILCGTIEPFRAQFGSGGEDRDFFKRMIEKGNAFVWCDEAIAYEVVPPTRWSRSFMLRRALLRGKMALHQRRGMFDLAKSACAVAGYGVALPFMLLIGHHRGMKCLIRLCDHAGKLLAVFGINPIREKYVIQ